MGRQHLRHFHLTDFHTRDIYVQLDPDFGKSFFSKILDQISLKTLAEELDSKIDLLARYAVNYREDLVNPVFIELGVLLKLISTHKKFHRNSDILSDVERNVRAIKGYGRSGLLRNPRIPIKEDNHLVRLVVHLIGDGTLTEEYGTTKTPHYTNGNAVLLNQFHSTLGQVFGDVTCCTRKYIDRHGKSRSYVAFTKWLGYLLRHWYPDAGFDELHGSLPSAFLQLPLELKREIVQTFGDDDGHVGAHSIRFTSGGSTILEQIRSLIVELMVATLPVEEFQVLLKSVGEVKACRSWFILDVYRPVFGWYVEHIGFSHPERAERLRFQLACDSAWVERGLDGFDLDFLTLIGLREVGSVADVARRFVLREDFLFRVVERLRQLGWIRRMTKQKFTTVYQTTSKGEDFLRRIWARGWCEPDRVVMDDAWWSELRGQLLDEYGTAAAVARVAGMPETTVRLYLQGRRQWMDARWVVALAKAVGWGVDAVSKGLVVGFTRKLAPRYEQCDFLKKQLEVYRQLSDGRLGFEGWLLSHRRDGGRSEQLLDVGHSVKLQTASAIRNRIVELARVNGGTIALEALKGDAVLQELVANRYAAYLADRMAKLIKQGVFVRVQKGRYQLVEF
ncbi:MAG: hypothetical protein ACFFBR_05465 [Promethearchaeota archaeon]